MKKGGKYIETRKLLKKQPDLSNHEISMKLYGYSTTATRKYVSRQRNPTQRGKSTSLPQAESTDHLILLRQKLAAAGIVAQLRGYVFFSSTSEADRRTPWYCARIRLEGRENEISIATASRADFDNERIIAGTIRSVQRLISGPPGVLHELRGSTYEA